MLVYRICKAVYQNDLSGAGARENGGRWNSVGLPLIYASATASLALLEMVCNMPISLLSADFILMTVEIPDSVEIELVNVNALPKGWKEFQSYSICRKIGDAWIKKNKNTVLSVPSAAMPLEQNFLINPFSSVSGLIKIKSIIPIDFDARIIQNVLKNR